MLSLDYPKPLVVFLWINNAFVHFLSMVSQNVAFCLKFCSSSSCDFNYAMLPLNSSLSSCSFLMSTWIFCSTSTLFFLQISTLCLYPFLNSLSLSYSSYNIAFSFSLVANMFSRVFTSKVKFPIFRLIIAMVWNNYVTLSNFITFVATSSTDFGVLVCVVDL